MNIPDEGKIRYHGYFLVCFINRIQMNPRIQSLRSVFSGAFLIVII